MGAKPVFAGKSFKPSIVKRLKLLILLNVLPIIIIENLMQKQRRLK